MKKTKMYFARLAILALAVAAFAPLGSATTLCPTLAPGSLASIGVQAAATITATGICNYGATTFSNISLTGSSTSGALNAIDPTLVDVQVTQSGGGQLLNLTLSDPTGWALAGTQQFDLILSYTVTGGPWFQSFGDNIVGSNTANGNGTGAVSFDKEASNNGTTTTLTTLSLSGITSNPQTAFLGSPAPPLSTFNIVDNIQVHATNASATLNTATNSFVVPEPMTSMLLGSGLLAFGLLLRRKRG